MHFPTRGRREQAERTIADYWSLADNPERLSLSLACNSLDDVPANHPSTIDPIIRPFHSKIAAYNAVPLDIEWDIVLGASDDMWCIQRGWDTIIEETMRTHFQDTDGCLWFWDGRQVLDNPNEICTFSIMGRAAFETDGYLYHPDYLSFFCDNEWTDVWRVRQKLYRDPRCLFRNEHYAWGGSMGVDATYKLGFGPKNTKWRHDEHLYHKRKIQGFPQ